MWWWFCVAGVRGVGECGGRDLSGDVYRCDSDECGDGEVMYVVVVVVIVG